MIRWLAALSPRVRVLLVALVLLAVVATLYSQSRTEDPSIVLLIPNEAARELPVTQAWLDAAREEGLSVLMVTHEPDMADYANRIVTFVDGRIQSDKVRDRHAA